MARTPERILASALLVAVAGGATAATAPTQAHVAKELRAPITLAIAGDSLSDYTDVPVSTWPMFLGDDVVVDPTQGYAVGGSRIHQIRDGMTATTADLLVLMGGTNDLGHGVAADRLPVVVDLVARAHAPRVLVLAVPPLHDVAIWPDRWNARLADLAQYYGWDFFDPWTPFRTDDGLWVEGASYDGIHPTAKTSEAIAATIEAYILALD